MNADVRFMPKWPRELPPQPLAEPYVTFSRHTAPVIQPWAGDLPMAEQQWGGALHLLQPLSTSPSAP
jgi:hypothetical protein